jgi:hypothetical protein
MTGGVNGDLRRRLVNLEGRAGGREDDPRAQAACYLRALDGALDRLGSRIRDAGGDPDAAKSAARDLLDADAGLALLVSGDIPDWGDGYPKPYAADSARVRDATDERDAARTAFAAVCAAVGWRDPQAIFDVFFSDMTAVIFDEPGAEEGGHDG